MFSMFVGRMCSPKVNVSPAVSEDVSRRRPSVHGGENASQCRYLEVERSVCHVVKENPALLCSRDHVHLGPQLGVDVFLGRHHFLGDTGDAVGTISDGVPLHG